jgi:hypothetical protein
MARRPYHIITDHSLPLHICEALTAYLKTASSAEMLPSETLDFRIHELAIGRVTNSSQLMDELSTTVFWHK